MWNELETVKLINCLGLINCMCPPYLYLSLSDFGWVATVFWLLFILFCSFMQSRERESLIMKLSTRKQAANEETHMPND